MPLESPSGTDAEADSEPACLGEQVTARGVSRRRFLTYCAGLTALMALPPTFAPRVAHALEKVTKPKLVWFEFQDCAGDTESFLRARNPAVGDLILDLVSVDYQETIMAASGFQAEAALAATIAEGGHIVVVEGSVPLKDGGIYCTVGGKTAQQRLAEAVKGAVAVINVGTCSAFGGLPAAHPNPTGAVGVPDVVSGVPIINLPGCPANADNITATLAHYLTFGALPATDDQHRPLFAYGDTIHANCPRRGHFDAGEFVREWGDEGHRKGWCLYQMGCKGPSTFSNCPKQLWNDGTNWPVGAGVGCIGCTQPGFWDTSTPFYGRLPKVAGLDVQTSAEKIGVALVGATAAGLALHGAGKAIQHTVHERRESKQAEKAVAAPAAGKDLS